MKQSRLIDLLIGRFPLLFGMIAAIFAPPPMAWGQVTCPGSDPEVLDCNDNGTDDFCDIQAGTSQDCNTNGTPDECDTGEVSLDWRRAFPNQQPSARHYLAMTYDSTRGVIVLFGGKTNGAVFGDTWEWDGGVWTLRATMGPSPRFFHAMAYDSGRGVTVLFGGHSNQFPGGVSNAETWEWNGVEWSHRTTGGPSPRRETAIAYDSSRGVTVLFGGYDGSYDDETWEWDGDAWALRATGGPSPRTSHAMAYDSDRGVVVLFGGFAQTGQNETWEWDGSAWALRAAFGPHSRAWHQMAYDSARGVTVTFGGWDDVYFADTWEWNGDSWVERDISGPFRRAGYGLAYDRLRGMAVLFGGGSDPIAENSESWILGPASADCNANTIPDECLSEEMDCNTNGIPDACEVVAPCPQIVSAESRRTHGGGVGPDDIVVNPAGQIGLGNVTSEPRVGGIVELRVAFDATLGGPGPNPVSIEQRTCGDGGAYVPYAGAAVAGASLDGNELVLTFAPPLENARTYRFTVGPEVTLASNQRVEVRGLMGDVSSSGRVNATDRSTVVGVWTGAGYSAPTDIDLSGATNATDRSLVVAAWTGTENCAP